MQLRALVVDGDPVEQLNSMALFREAGYEAIGVSSCNEARQWLAQQSFDLILLEIAQQDCAGLLLCNEIRTQLQSKPVIILTCMNSKPSLGVVGLELGADDFVAK